MKITLLLLLSLSGFVILAEQADNLRAEQFSKFGVLIDGDESVLRVELPFHVLNDATRADLADVHVFDAQDQLMPSDTFYLKSRKETYASEVGLQFFPFAANADRESVRYAFQIEQGGETRKISLSDNGQSRTGAGAKTNYVVHIPQATRRERGAVTQLTLNWAKPEENLIVPVRIEGSKDLQTWQTLAGRAVVSNLEHDGRKLVTNTVKLKKFSGAYLRLSWPEHTRQFDVQSISAEFSRNEVKAAQLRRHRIACTVPEPGVCQFDVPPQVSVQSFEIVTGLGQYFLQGALYSSAPSDTHRAREWRRRSNFQQYRLIVDSQEISNTDLRLPDTFDRVWQLRFEDPVVDLNFAEIEVAWYPVYQVFLAQGQGPYRLAYGNSGAINSHGSAIKTILGRANKRMDEVEIVTLGPVQAVQQAKVFWTRQRVEVFMLWTVLLAGVAVLFRLAWGLFRNMDHG